MKAIVFHGIGDIALDDVPERELLEPTDALVRITTSAICGTDLHLVRGTLTNPVETIHDLTASIGVDRAVDAGRRGRAARASAGVELRSAA